MRTKKEIDAEVKKGEKFVKEHPYSMFGNDNAKQFKLFMRIIDMVREGKSLDAIEDLINDAYEDEELTFALDVVEWLRGNIEEIY
jgi:predicted transcriptional regulator